jgi:CubicO group peptidase (beta-lactamase class C family)
MPRHSGSSMKMLAVLVLCFAGFDGPIRADSTSDAWAALGPAIDQARERDQLPGLAVAVSRHGKILYEKGFGWSNKEQRIPATEHTMFSLASVSKPITTTGLMTLVRTGKVSLDRPVNEYLGKAKLKARMGKETQATVRRVANHSSGLPLHFQYFFSDEPYAVPSPDESILHYGNLVTPPGEHYQYSNLGYGLLDEVIRRASGQTFASYLHQHVFAPLGMNHTSVGIDPALAQFSALRYDDDGSPLPPYVTDTPGSSMVYSSAHDLIRFGMFHLKDHLSDQVSILSDAELDELHRPTMLERGAGGHSYAIGWEVIDQSDGYRVVSHTGGMPGVATALVLVPSEDIAVALVANGFRYDLEDVLGLVMRMMLPRWTGNPLPPEKKPPPFDPPTQIVGTWTGRVHTYAGDRALQLRILPDGRVDLRVGDHEPQVVTDVAINGRTLSGITRGELDTPDLRRRQPYSLELNLQVGRRTLTGCLTAFRSEGRPFGLSHWAELHQAPR